MLRRSRERRRNDARTPRYLQRQYRGRRDGIFVLAKRAAPRAWRSKRRLHASASTSAWYWAITYAIKAGWMGTTTSIWEAAEKGAAEVVSRVNRVLPEGGP